MIDTDLSVHDFLTPLEQGCLANTRTTESVLMTRSKRVIIMKKVFVQNLNLYDTISDILSVVDMPYEIRMGLSFIGIKTDFENYDYMHFFAIRQRSMVNDYRLIEHQEDAEKLLRFIKPFSYSDLLNHTFEMNNVTNPFTKSGFRPHKLCMAVFWLTKL